MSIATAAGRGFRFIPAVMQYSGGVEVGFPLVLSDSWFGLITRADVPAPARARLEQLWLAALARPEIKGRLEEQAFAVLARPSAQFGAEIRRYAETYAQVIRANNITVN